MGLLDGADRAVKAGWNRLYANFLMPARLDEYERLLRAALGCEYQVHSIVSFWQQLQGGRAPLRGTNHLILRHDVDTDPATAEQMWRVERKLGVSSTYYFRLSTLSFSLMKEMDDSGFEASYHYEEVATVAKQRGLSTPGDVYRELPRMRAIFSDNLRRLREQTGLPMITAASHGDFINRKLGIANTVMLDDKAFRAEVGISLEAYDQELNTHVTSRHADRPYPLFWYPDDPLSAITRREPVILVLTHPRQWRASPAENLSQDFGRLWEGARYRITATARRAFHSAPLS